MTHEGVKLTWMSQSHFSLGSRLVNGGKHVSQFISGCDRKAPK
jgi:hypothetical protein